MSNTSIISFFKLMSLESFYNSPPKSLVTIQKYIKIPIKKELELNKFGLLNIVGNNVLLVKMIRNKKEEGTFSCLLNSEVLKLFQTKKNSSSSSRENGRKLSQGHNSVVSKNKYLYIPIYLYFVFSFFCS